MDSAVARANRLPREHRESASPRALDFACSRPDIVSTLGPSRPTKGTVAPPSQRDSGSNLLLRREGDTRRILLEEGAGVTEALRAIRGPLFGLFLAAVDTGDNKAASTLSGRLHENLARTAKLTGEFVPHAGTSITNILLSPNFQRLRAELIRVLARYPQVQAEVTAVFRQAGLRAATEIGGSAEKMIEGFPVVRSKGSPRPWLRAADNHGYRRLACRRRINGLSPRKPRWEC